ncbi:hypothetical protein [Massilia sp. TWR1-2-2]|uniref:hypothetical protein n=1 Tax=Massilia sp. TWR1-2-2 TaxID=2804584 RepID=UPI003CF823A5
MNRKKIFLAPLIGLIFAPAFADEADPAPQPRVVTQQRIEMRGLDGLAGMHFGPRMGMMVKAVKNAPYSAEAVSERQQNLADGNQIVRKTSSMSYRDSAGRTRQEMRDDKGEVQTVTIHDPVESTTYILSPRTRTATRITANKEIGKAAAEAARAKIDQLRKEGKLPAERREIIVRHLEGHDGDLTVHVGEGTAVRIEAPNMQVTPGSRDMLVRLGPLSGALGDVKWSKNATAKDLGTREIEGVKAEGKLRSYEIPAGEVGNRSAIVVSDESWYSPELQVTLLTKHSDPRAGDNTYRLTSLKREEPAAALFTVPSDYTVKDALANMHHLLEKKAP